MAHLTPKSRQNHETGQLSPLRRGLILGFMRAKLQSRKELRTLAQSFDDKLLALQHEFHELAVAHYRQCYAAAVDEALIERSARPGMLLH